MRMYDLIAKKRDGGALSREELEYLIGGYVKGEIPDYQMSAFFDGSVLSGNDGGRNLGHDGFGGSQRRYGGFITH